MADKRLMSEWHLSEVRALVRQLEHEPMSGCAWDLLGHVDVQAEQIVKLESTIQDFKNREAQWRAQAKEILCPSDLKVLGIACEEEQ